MTRAFSIIVACDETGGIGLKGELPWRLSADLKHFKQLTTGDGNNAVIMGRKTWDSIPSAYRPLPGRLNIVLSRKEQLELPEQVLHAPSLADALELASAQENCFVIGGGHVYAEALRHGGCSDIYLTAIAGSFACDTFFQTEENNWELASESEPKQENSIRFSFCHYTRK